MKYESLFPSNKQKNNEKVIIQMKKLSPHIYLEQCQSALDYYAQIFGGEIKNTQLADGIEMFKGHEGKLIHAELHINEPASSILQMYLDTSKKEITFGFP